MHKIDLQNSVMTRKELLEKVAKHQLWTVSWKEFHELFPGRCLTDVEMQFKIEFANAGGGDGKTYNPTGSSQHDKLMRFLDQNKLSYRLLDGLPTFYRGRIDFSEYEANAKEKDSHGRK